LDLLYYCKVISADYYMNLARNMNKITINHKIKKAIDDIVNNTCIINDRLFFKHSVLDVKFQELSNIINNNDINKLIYEGINLYDLRSIYMNKLEQEDINDLVGGKREFEFGKGYYISKKFKNEFNQTIRGIKSKSYTVKLTIENLVNTCSLNQIDGVKVLLDKKSNKFTIEIIVNGYFDFNKNKNEIYSIMRYSAVDKALIQYKLLLTYLSFLKDTIYAEKPSISTDIMLTIENDENKSYQILIDDIFLYFYALNTDYTLRYFSSDKLLTNFLTIITNQEHMCRSLDWYYSSLIENNINKKVIDLCIGFEMLYGGASSIGKEGKNKNTVALKAVYSIDKNLRDRQEHHQNIIDLFNMRNKIVHSDLKHADSDVNKYIQYNINKKIFIRAFVHELGYFKLS